MHWLTDNRDIENVTYDDGLIKLATIDRAKLPDLKPANSILGSLRPEIAREWGLREDVRVVIGSPDIHSAAIGSGAPPTGPIVESLEVIAVRPRVALGVISPGLHRRGLVQLIWTFPEASRLAVLAVDLQTGAVRRLPGGRGREVWRTLWAPDGRLYLGMNGPHDLKWRTALSRPTSATTQSDSQDDEEKG